MCFDSPQNPALAYLSTSFPTKSHTTARTTCLWGLCLRLLAKHKTSSPSLHAFFSQESLCPPHPPAENKLVSIHSPNIMTPVN